MLQYQNIGDELNKGIEIIWRPFLGLNVGR